MSSPSLYPSLSYGNYSKILLLRTPGNKVVEIMWVLDCCIVARIDQIIFFLQAAHFFACWLLRCLINLDLLDIFFSLTIKQKFSV